MGKGGFANLGLNLHPGTISSSAATHWKQLSSWLVELMAPAGVLRAWSLTAERCSATTEITWQTDNCMDGACLCLCLTHSTCFAWRRAVRGPRYYLSTDTHLSSAWLRFARKHRGSNFPNIRPTGRICLGTGNWRDIGRKESEMEDRQTLGSQIPPS